jgi:hypothetical protein
VKRNTHQVIDFGSGPSDTTLGYPFEGTSEECFQWLAENGEIRSNGTSRYGVQYIPIDENTDHHTVMDAADDTIYGELVIHKDIHGMSVTLPDGQAIVLDVSSGKVSVYHFSNEDDDDPALLGSFANGYAALEGK